MRAHTAPQLYQRTPGGAWWCYWRDERWSTRTRDRAEADRIVRERYDPRVAASREKVVEDAILLVYEALDRRGRAQATRDQSRQKLGNFARLWAGRVLGSIDYAAMQDYVRVRLGVDKVQRLTVSHEIGYWRQAWKLARAHGWVARSWEEIWPERFDRGYRPRTRWLPPHELSVVLSELPGEQAAVVAWIVATGCDIADVWRARSGDVHWRKGLVFVRGTKNIFRERFVPITAITRALLQRASKFGPPFEPWPSIGQSLRRVARRLGLDHFSPKDLRRTHGQWLRAAGVEPHLIGRVLGHADSVMADRVYAQGDEDAIARLVHVAIARTTGLYGSKRTDVVTKPGARGRKRSRPARRSA